MHGSDLDVERTSTALSGWSLDVVVTGSIGAVESVRFVRALRRLGADVTPWLTAGGAQFVTPLALGWAAAREPRNAFAGDASHIALGDAVVVAPASASFLAKMAHGLADTPASALAQSYLGQRKPVLALPNMHDSLAASPAALANHATLADWGVCLLGAREEEGKKKFPDPALLADQVAHQLNARRHGSPAVLVTMGTTRGYFDAVRYISNYSSGSLGTHIAEELYRRGLTTHVVAGPSQVRPRAYSHLAAVETNDEMQKAAAHALAQGAQGAVLAASVLDFAPRARQAGKIKSKDHLGGLTVELVSTSKIIAGLSPAAGVKVGFKLETGLTEERARAIAADYMPRYGLSLFVANDLADVDTRRHRALVFAAGPSGQPLPGAPALAESKAAVAGLVADHVAGALASHGRSSPGRPR
jgi:phosphopantothenoylcysteine decarboxylase/phosphopantothenate--cysteine ligase